MNIQTQKDLLRLVLGKNLQITTDAIRLISEQSDPKKALENSIQKLEPQEFLLTTTHFTKTQSISEKKIGSLFKTEVSIIQNFTKTPYADNLQTISDFFRARYNYFKKVLSSRTNNTMSLAHAEKAKGEKCSLIGIVSDKRVTKNSVILELEDPTGVLKTITTSPEANTQAESIVLDEVVALEGSMGDDIFFTNNIIQPDLPTGKHMKKLSDSSYAAFLSDIHIGSKKFLRKEFKNLLDWFNSDVESNMQREITDNINYIFIAGDLVDGIGVYPNQKDGLYETDITKQYTEAAKLLSKIPENIEIIICPGNHDYTHLAQPQTPLTKDIAPELNELNNVTMVSNPSLVNIHTSDGGGLNTLLYHGTSIDTIVASDKTFKDGYKHPEIVMLALLKKRHLSPIYSSDLVTSGQDSMVIPSDIDIFHTGHVHSNGAMNYRGVTMLNSGTWQGKTDFQELCGHEPTPGNLPVINMKSREMQLINFYKNEPTRI